MYHLSETSNPLLVDDTKFIKEDSILHINENTDLCKELNQMLMPSLNLRLTILKPLSSDSFTVALKKKKNRKAAEEMAQQGDWPGEPEEQSSDAAPT